MNKEKLGFSNWFKDRINSTDLNKYQIARVITVNKDSYIINNGNDDVYAEITGKLMFKSDSPLDYPTTGDWVLVQFFNEESFAVIHEILPRKSLLKRKASGEKIEYQIIAANVDAAFIIQSLDFDYNIRRLERYLTMINECNIYPVVLLSKSDLISYEEIERKKADIYNVMPNIQIVTCTNSNVSGFNGVKDLLEPGKTYCLLGSSGVGKTTLINNLLGDVLFKTGTVRKNDGKGRHVTTSRQLIILDNGAMIIDTPGMRELGNFSIDSGLENTFNEISELSYSCRYKDCTHTIEKGCAVLTALKDGLISIKRYENYMKMKKESIYNEMSYYEKRQKDKQFGKMCKSIIKQKKNRT
ncbi:MAG: ribosome small subunit-dependent GTPase A [Spirochaetota bacterium]|nr:ribosome small subunit-dependent GTPase A [Spirochaetota bacterium]